MSIPLLTVEMEFGEHRRNGYQDGRVIVVELNEQGTVIDVRKAQ
jgi:hypothetical protein